jgi:hypothetical protein
MFLTVDDIGNQLRMAAIEKSIEGNRKKDEREEAIQKQKDKLIQFFKGLKLKINKIHMRYEDDYYQADTPYSFGVVIESASINTSDTTWDFQKPSDVQFFRS